MNTLSINNDLNFIQNYLTEHKTQMSKIFIPLLYTSSFFTP